MRKEVKKAASNISRLVPALMSGVELEFFSQSDITSSQLITIMTLHSSGRSAMGELAKNHYVTMPTMTGLIDRLVKLGLVRRSLSEQDRRKVYIELAPKGKELIKDVQSIIRRRWNRLLSALTPNEIESFQKIMVKLNNHIKEQRV